jgi:hypothetical protein
MAILMEAPMAVVMMLMMGEMYPDKKMNVSIIAGAIFVFVKRSILEALTDQRWRKHNLPLFYTKAFNKLRPIFFRYQEKQVMDSIS